MEYYIEVIDNRALVAPLLPTEYKLEATDITEAWKEFERICEENKYQGDLTFIFSVRKRPYLEVKDELCSWDGCFEKHNSRKVGYHFRWYHGQRYEEGMYCQKHYAQILDEEMVIICEVIEKNER